MPMPKPYWDDEESPQDEFDNPAGGAGGQYQALPNYDALDVPQKPKGTAGSRAAALAASMPQAPNPSVWRKLAAAGLGFAGGYLNSNAGRPGGLAHPVDAQPAADAVLGMPQYQRQLAGWQQKVKLAEYQDTIEEKQAEAQEKAKDFNLRTAMYRDQHQLQADNRAEAQAGRDQNVADRYVQQNEVVDPAAQQSTARGYLPSDDGQLPVGQLPMPTYGVTPPTALTPGGVRPGAPMPQMVADQHPGAQPFAYSKPEIAAQTAQAQLQPVPEELQGVLGPKATNGQIIQAMRDAGKQPHLDKGEQNDELIASRTRQADANHLTGRDRQSFILTGKLVDPGMNIVMPPLPQPTQPPDAQGRQMDLLGKLPPNLQAKTKALLDYRATVSPLQLSPRKGQDNSWAQAADAAMQIDPNWDMKEYHNRQRVMQNYTPSGPSGKNIVSLNTLSGHIDQMITDLNRLNNGDNTALNSINNWLQGQFGAAPVTNAAAARTAVAAELATALKGNATDTEIKQWAENTKGNLGPQQIAGLKKTLADIMYQRLGMLDYGYTQQMGGKHAPGILAPSTVKLLLDTGHDLSPLGGPAAQQGAPAGGALPDGKGQQLSDHGVKDAFLQAAGGDKNKARELARQHNWVF